MQGKIVKTSKMCKCTGGQAMTTISVESVEEMQMTATAAESAEDTQMLATAADSTRCQPEE